MAQSGASRARKRGAVRERLHDAIARKMGVAIVSGHFRPGDILDNEIHSSEQLHVSRTAYREAVRVLAAKGLVESRPKTGTRVCERRRWSLLDPDVLAWYFEAGAPSGAFLRDLFELRLIVEPAAAALAAERRTPEDLARLRGALVEMEGAGLAVEAGQIADREFHDGVIEATGNAPLQTLASGIGAAVRWTTLYKQQRLASPRDPMPEHWRVFHAIDAGDAEAARQAMYDLVAMARDDTRTEIEN